VKVRLALIALALASPAAAKTAASKPVIVGKAGDDLDACHSNAIVSGLNPRGDNFLAVRAAPSTRAAKLAELKTGHALWVCDASADAKWLGVVYNGAGEEFDCEVASPVPQPVAYAGPCRSGWVAARYVTVIAG
jgi:hypothetical protein